MLNLPCYLDGNKVGQWCGICHFNSIYIGSLIHTKRSSYLLSARKRRK